LESDGNRKTSSSSVTAPANAYSISVVGESVGNLPFKLQLLDPSGFVLATSDNSSGLAVLDVPVTQGGTYVIKTINLSVGPIDVWTAATPNTTR